MRATSTPFRFASWLAMAAMALNALWPLLANAKPAGQAALFEICTAAGISTVSGDTGTAPAEGGERHLIPHCALCTTGTDKAPAASQNTPLVMVEAAVAVEHPWVTLHGPAVTQPRSQAQPRAPPVLS